MHMKTFITIIILGALVFLGYSIWSSKTIQKPTPTAEQPVESILGCYKAGNEKDIYTFNISSQNNEIVSGTLAFNNFEKDSSKGSFSGTYRNSILLGNYTFQSEGMNSVMEVAFKKVGNNFVRGYGEVNADGTTFVNPETITYEENELSVFKKTPCESETTITYPKGGEKLIKGQSYSLTWSGGQNTTQIFLIDTSLKSAGASVSIVDRVYNVENTGSYKYTVPKNLKDGTYEFQIGNVTSAQFQIGA
jgi:hypothetical protein